MKEYPAIVKCNSLVSIDEEVKCPFCDSDNLQDFGTETTCVGWDVSSGEKNNPNHTHTGYECRACGKSFARQTRFGEVWYTERIGEESVVVRGMPNCFEHYVLTCSYCNGMIRKRYQNKKGYDPKYLGEYLNGEKDYITWYCCNRCGRQETLDDVSVIRGTE